MPKITYSPETGLVTRAGSGIELGGNIVQGGLSKIHALSTGDVANAADLTLTSADCGCIVAITDSRKGIAIVLPTATDNPGWWCDITITATAAVGNGATSPADDITVTGGTFKLLQRLIAAASESPDSGTTMTIEADLKIIGDRCRIISDGTNYIARARAATAAAWVAA